MTAVLDTARAVEMNALRRLIANRREEEERYGRSLSYADIARRGGLPRSTVYKLASQETWVRAPSGDTLDRLAKGLSLPTTTVREAAAEMVGLHTSETTTPDGMKMLVGSLHELDDDERAQVSALVRAMLSGRRRRSK